MHRPLPDRPAAQWIGRPFLLLLVAVLVLPVAVSTAPRVPVAAERIAVVAQEDSPSGEPSPAPSAELPLTDARSTFLLLGYPDQKITASLMTSVVEVPLRPSQTLGTDSHLVLRFEASSLLDHEASSLTVSVNGQVRRSTTLEEANGQVAELLVPLEATDRLPQTASVVLTIDTRLVTAGAGCPPAIDPGRWLVIRSDSSIEFDRTNLDQSAGLADLPSLFMPATPDPVSREGDISARAVTIVVGQGAAPEEFQAAGHLATALGRWSAERQVPTTILFADQIPPDQPAIVVSAGVRFAGSLTWGDVSWDGTTWRTPNGAVPSDRGLLALQRSVVPRLLVSSATPDGVLDAAAALVRPGRANNLAGSWAILTGREVLTPELRSPSWDGNTATFGQLGAGTYSFSGTGAQQMSLTFPRPAGWLLSGGSHLILDVSVSGNISPDSSLSLTLNGHWMGSMPLRAGGQDAVVGGSPETAPTRQAARFEVPASQLGAVSGADRRSLSLVAGVNLGVGATCAGLTPPTVTILPGSRWVLPHETERVLELASFPAPLAGDPLAPVTPLIAVVPDWPTTAEMQVAMRTLAAVARWSAGDARSLPVLIPVSRLTETDRTATNLIVIGTATRNPVAGDLVRRYGGLVNAPGQTSTTGSVLPALGQVALLPSPWRSGGATLLLTSTTDAGVTQTGGAFEDVERLNQLSGGVATVTGSSEVESTQVARAPAIIDEGLTERFGWNRYVVLFTIAGIMALIFLGAWLASTRSVGQGRDRRN
ncbi:MAG TPA: cellulose biosynthesis cyclic di-GMP-binding regulatory protein BcsB [Thermomicrobiales bacterium]|jgi:hypothetical protein|nr:cellulose biosynthesis cyclic di-GMP-binding regulatory protein BcsB [Thermomicrobiales bacterium]